MTLAALDADGVDRVEIHHAVENVPSSGVPRILGYRLIGEVLGEPLPPGLCGVQWVWRLPVADLDEGICSALRQVGVRPDRTGSPPLR